MIPGEVDYERIGKRIRKLRIEKGLTQAALSAMADCSNNYLSHVETAQTKITLGIKPAFIIGKKPSFGQKKQTRASSSFCFLQTFRIGKTSASA